MLIGARDSRADEPDRYNLAVPAEQEHSGNSGRLKAATVVIFGAAMGTLIILHVPWLNGPPFWPWPWRTLPPLTTYSALAGAAIPFVLAQLLYARLGPRAIWMSLILIMAGCLGMKLGSLVPYTDPPGLEMIPAIVEHPDATSYYTDAAALSSAHSTREWLELYPQYMPELSLHTKTKAPGPTLYYAAFINLFGFGRTAAMAGGMMLGVLATFSIPATYLLLRTLSEGDREAAFHGASFLALCPGFVLFFPMFDPTYLMLSCTILALWAVAVERRDWRWALGSGVALALTCIVTFNVLVIGVWMALYPFVIPQRRPSFAAVLRLAAIALGTWFVLLVMLDPAIGYDPFTTFATAWRVQHDLIEQYKHFRPYPLTIPWDLIDFAMGAGWVAVPLAGFYLASGSSRRDEPRLWRLGILSIVQFVIVAITGIFQTETARVWNLMLPLLMLPVGLELRHARGWNTPRRLAIYAALWFVLAAIAQNMKLVL